MRVPRWTAASVCTIALAGCGIGPGGQALLAILISITIIWITAANDAVGQLAAQARSSAITVPEAGQGGTPLSFVVNRGSPSRAVVPARQAGDETTLRESYNSPVDVPIGSRGITARVYDQAGGQGNLVAVANSSVSVNPIDPVTAASVPPISMEQNITSVEIAPGQSVQVGEARELVFRARGPDSGSPNAAIMAVLVAPASYNADPNSPGAVGIIAAEGRSGPEVVGSRVGPVALTITVATRTNVNGRIVDGSLTSPVQTLTVTPGPVGTQRHH